MHFSIALLLSGTAIYRLLQYNRLKSIVAFFSRNLRMKNNVNYRVIINGAIQLRICLINLNILIENKYNDTQLLDVNIYTFHNKISKPMMNRSIMLENKAIYDVYQGFQGFKSSVIKSSVIKTMCSVKFIVFIINQARSIGSL